MPDINDVCDYIIAKAAEDSVGLSVLKLQKLLYYCQAWHLAFEKGRLFDSRFQAWVHGPVSRQIYDRFKDNKYIYSAVTHADIRSTFCFDNLSTDARQHIDAVLTAYAEFTGDQLEYMTHVEQPWLTARGELPLHARCETEIDEDIMRSYYAARLTRK